MSNTSAVHTTIAYIGGRETCQGLAVIWNDNAQVLAHRHREETQHNGIWYERTTKATYQVTPALTVEEMEHIA